MKNKVVVAILIALCCGVCIFGIISYNSESEFIERSIHLSLNEEIRLSYFDVEKYNYNNITPNIVELDDNKIVAKSFGEGIIEAKKNKKIVRLYFKIDSNSISEEVNKVDIKELRAETKIEILEGETKKVEVEILPKEATNRALLWSSSNKNIVTIDENGLLKAIKKGTAEITVKSKNGKEVKIEIEVKENKEEIEAEKVIVNSDSLEIRVGKSAQIVYEILPKNTTDKSIKWNSTNPEVLEVNEGIITGKKEGQSEVEILTSTGKKAVIKVEVTKEKIEVTGVSINKPEIELVEEAIDTLTVSIYPITATDKSVIWTSSNKEVAEVANGVITAKKEGSTTIIVRTTNGKEAKCNVRVNKKVIVASGVVLDKNKIMLEEEATSIIKAEIYPVGTNQSITWTSSDETIAKVSSEGKITGIKEGTAIITATSANGKEGKCIVTVAKKATTETVRIIYDYYTVTKTGEKLTVSEEAAKNEIESYKTKLIEAKEPDTSYGYATHECKNAVAKKEGNKYSITSSTNAEAVCRIKYKRYEVTMQHRFYTVTASGSVLAGSSKMTTHYQAHGTTLSFTHVWGNTAFGYRDLTGGCTRISGDNSRGIYNSSGNTVKTCYADHYRYEITMQHMFISKDVDKDKNVVNEKITNAPSAKYYKLHNEPLTYKYRWDTASFGYKNTTGGCLRTGGTNSIGTYSLNKDQNSIYNCVAYHYRYKTQVIYEYRTDSKVTSTIVAGTGYRAHGSAITIQTKEPYAIYSNSSIKGCTKNSKTSYTFSANTTETECISTFDFNNATGIVIKKDGDVVKKITMDNYSVTNLSATISPSNVTNKNVTWTSSNPNVATVDSTGKVVGKGVGTVLITAKTHNGKTATCTVEVQKLIAIDKGETVTVSGTGVTSWYIEQLNIKGYSNTNSNVRLKINSTDKTKVQVTGNTTKGVTYVIGTSPSGNVVYCFGVGLVNNLSKVNMNSLDTEKKGTITLKASNKYKPLKNTNEWYSLNEKDFLERYLTQEVNQVGDGILRGGTNYTDSDGKYEGSRAGAVRAARFLALQFQYVIPYTAMDGMGDGIKANNHYSKAGLYDLGEYVDKNEKQFNGNNRIVYTYGYGLNIHVRESEGIANPTINNKNGLGCWGCPTGAKNFTLSNGGIRYIEYHGLHCSSFVAWSLFNGGFDIYKDTNTYGPLKHSHISAPTNLPPLAYLSHFIQGSSCLNYNSKLSTTDWDKIKPGDLMWYYPVGATIQDDGGERKVTEEDVKCGSTTLQYIPHGHIGMIIGIDKKNNYMYIAHQTAYKYGSGYYGGMSVDRLPYKSMPSEKQDWRRIILMDKVYEKEGNLSYMW